MSRMLGVLIVAMLGTPAGAADQFDLICEGVVREQPLGPERPVRHRFSIDTAASRYCKTSWFQGRVFNEACRDVLSVYEITLDRITFLEPSHGRFYYIDRQSGQLVHFSRNRYQDEKGQCELADYRPLPAPRF